MNEFESRLFEIVNNADLNAESITDCMKSIHKDVYGLVATLQIAQIKVLPFGDSQLFSSILGENNTELLNTQKPYDEEEDNFIDCVFTTLADFSIVVRVYPVHNVKWDDDTIQRVRQFVKILYFVTSRTRVYNLLGQVFYNDYSTGIPNSHGLRKYISSILENGDITEYSCYFINLKKISHINQKYGTNVTDEVIRSYARKVRDILGEDGMIARRGGDNFTIISKKPIPEVLKTLKMVRVDVATENERHVFMIKSRVGVYDIASDVLSSDFAANLILTRTSMAFGQTRRPDSEDVVFFSLDLVKQRMQEQEHLNHIHAAILKREFIVYYQPKVNIVTNELVGAEALVRWDKNGTILPPAAFIPLMEREGLVCELDFQVFEQVCCQIREWIAMGIEPICISTNFSREHLNNKNTAEKIMGIINRYGIDPKYLEIEITETFYHENYEAMFEFITVLRQFGLRVAIDDFGTGYSSLNMLSKYNVDCIKIDKSFLDNIINGDEKDRRLFSNIVKMISDMELEIIAEGVETKEQVEYLKRISCNVVQGYYYDKPLPVEEFESKISRR